MCKDKAQNKINYIVLQRPDESAKLLDKYGYQAPRQKEDLVKAVKLLVRKKGEPIIKELIAFHPDKKVILEVGGHKCDEESNFCGCHSSYSGETKELLDKLSELSVEDLTKRYDEVKKKSKENPKDTVLLAEVETVWDEIKRRKNQTQKIKSKEDNSLYLKLGIAFLAGIVVAKALS